MSGILHHMDEMPRARRVLALGLFVAVTMAIGFLGGLATMAKIPTWYAGLDKPWFNPPNWIFGPVWTVLYLVIAFAGWRIWLKPASTERDHALFVYAVQLVLNAAWSPAFFAAESPLLGLIVIVPFWISILLTIRAFTRLDRLAGMILWPYLAWVSFATLLNASILVLNWPDL